MALRTLMLKKSLDDKRAAFEKLTARSEELEKREKDLEAAIEEVTTQEERDAVSEEIEKFDADKADFEAEKKKLEDEIRGLEEELDSLEKAKEVKPEPEKAPEERKENKHMETRKFFRMNTQERDAFFAREDVQHFLGEVRSCIREKRALSNVGLTIPEVMLGLIRENTRRGCTTTGGNAP